MATYEGLVKLGTLRNGSTVKPRPTRPWRITTEPYTGAGVGNIADFSTDPNIGNWNIGNTDSNDANKLQWHKIKDGAKTLLVCDRVILVNVSWDDLNSDGRVFGKTITIDGQQYKLRLLTGGEERREGGTGTTYEGGKQPNEWDRFITNEDNISGLPVPIASDLDTTLNDTDKNSVHNQAWNWMGVYSWCQETYLHNSAYRASRGYSSARYWPYNSSSYRNDNRGWRPVLEILNSAPLISDSDRDLGNFSTPLQKIYTVIDPENDPVTIVEKIDGVVVRTIPNADQGANYIYDLTSAWGSLNLGSHTAVIEATDSKNAKSTRTWTFTKTGSVADAPVIISPINSQRTSVQPEIRFIIGSDPDGDTQTFLARFYDDEGMEEFEDITTGFEIYSDGNWVPITSATNDNHGAMLRIVYPRPLPKGSVKNCKIASIDSGSKTPSFSSPISMRIGNKLEINTHPSITQFQPRAISVMDKKAIDPEATHRVFVTNNALDPSPVWEEMTTEYQAGNEYVFKNKDKTHADWAVAVKHVVEANLALGQIEIAVIGVGVS